MAEHLPSKQDVVGSSPIARSGFMTIRLYPDCLGPFFCCCSSAVERVLGKDEVVGSIPTSSFGSKEVARPEWFFGNQV